MADALEINIITKMNEKQRRSHYIKKYYLDIYNNIISYNKSNLDIKNFTQMVYNYVYVIDDLIKCKICNKPTNFVGFVKGYNKYCSKKCVMSDVEIVNIRNEKTIKTCLIRYGVDNYSKTIEYKKKIKVTCLDKYGVDCYPKTEKFKEEMKKLNNEKYGVDWYQQTVEFKEKSKKSCIINFGEDHHMKSNNFKIKNIDINIKKWGVSNYSKTNMFKDTMNNYYNSNKFIEDIKRRKELINNKIVNFYRNYNSKYKFINLIKNNIQLECPVCNNIFDINKQLYYLRTKNNIDCCTFCNPTNGKNTSVEEKKVLNFIKSIYDGEIIENYKISKQEIDIYLPDLKFGIEYNGLYYHSEFYKDSHYHINKINFFRSFDIEIFMIYEDEWEFKKEIIKSVIKNKINKTPTSLMGRKCKIGEIDSLICNDFLESNHLQGKINSKVRLGLYFDNKLVSVMTFGNLRKSLGSKSKSAHWEMYRFCNLIDYNILGGASKLLNYFINNYKPKCILSYCDISHYNGKLYESIGFVKNKITDPNYYWVKNNIRYNRFSYRKDILVKKGYDKNKTESEIMHELKYYKIYNCGNIKFEMFL